MSGAELCKKNRENHGIISPKQLDLQGIKAVVYYENELYLFLCADASNHPNYKDIIDQASVIIGKDKEVIKSRSPDGSSKAMRIWNALWGEKEKAEVDFEDYFSSYLQQKRLALLEHMQNALAKLSGDLNYDNVAEAKKILKNGIGE